MKNLLAAIFIALASPAFAECASGYHQITVPLCQQSTGGVQAVAANTFLNSLGVNTHIDQGYPKQPYEAEFTYTGIRHFRDGGSPSNVTAYKALHTATVILGVPSSLLPSDQVSTGDALASAGALFAFECPNEPNNFPITYNGQAGGGAGTCVLVAAYQRDLYAAVKPIQSQRIILFTVSRKTARRLTIPGFSAAPEQLMPRRCRCHADASGHRVLGLCQCPQLYNRGVQSAGYRQHRLAGGRSNFGKRLLGQHVRRVRANMGA